MTQAVGIDIGATKIAAGLVDLAGGRVLRESTRPTDSARGGVAVLDECVELAGGLAGSETDAVGIGLCELVDRHGRPRSADTLDWRDLDIGAAFAPMRVTVESDVRAAARAEALYGAGRDFDEFVYLSVGSGVSYSLVVAGEPRAGWRGNAIIVGAPPVERLASGRALALAADLDRAEEVFDDAAHDHAVRAAAEGLGRALAALVNALDPQAVVVGGGLGLVDRYRELVATAAYRDIVADSTRRLPIVPAGLGAQNGVVGAALVATRAAERELQATHARGEGEVRGGSRS